MKVGIRFSSTCQTSRGGPTEPTTSKRSGKYSQGSSPSNDCLFRVQIHANCRIRRIYFSDRLYTEDELPPEFKLFLPIAADRNTAGGAGATTSNQMMK